MLQTDVPPETQVSQNVNLHAELPTDPGLGEIIAAVGRRRNVLMGTIVGSLALAGLFLYMAIPQYSAETLIMIEPENNNIVSIESVVTGLSGDDQTIQSEVFVLSSRALAGRVIRRLKLHDDREFNPELETIDEALPGGLSRVFSAIVEQFLERLTVMPKDKSRVISASFSSESAEKAATIINTLSEEYVLSRPVVPRSAHCL